MNRCVLLFSSEERHSLYCQIGRTREVRNRDYISCGNLVPIKTIKEHTFSIIVPFISVWDLLKFNKRLATFLVSLRFSSSDKVVIVILFPLYPLCFKEPKNAS